MDELKFKYIITEKGDFPKVSTRIEPTEKMPVSYITLLDQDVGQGEGLPLTEDEKDITDVLYGEDAVIKREGHLKEVVIFTDPVINDAKRIETMVYYKVIDKTNVEIGDVAVISGRLITPTVRDTASNNEEAMANHYRVVGSELSHLRAFQQQVR